MKRIANMGRVYGLWPMLISLAACSPVSFVDVKPPSTVVDPSVVTTTAGAMQLYKGAVNTFSRVFGGPNSCCNNTYLLAVGLSTDELMKVQGGSIFTDFDERTGTYPRLVYPTLHQPRVQARQAREALARYAASTPAVLQGQLYALEAYAILWITELYCSGIPLSIVPLDGTPVFTRGFTTQELFEHAVALFDTAMTLGVDSARFVNLAKVGKGRALLGLGRFADAAAAVQGVPTDFVYNTEHNAASGLQNIIGQSPRDVQVVDGEGGNGLVWSIDPRVATMTVPVTGAMKVTGKYSRNTAGTLDPSTSIADNPIRAADGLEARLIEAEADLANGGTNWLTILNTLRSTCIGTTPCAPVPGLAAAILPPLADPGSASTRLDLIMKERAMWLFLTGHRQGDLRRLARVYHRPVTTLWPTGVYTNPGFPPQVAAAGTNGTPYGTYVVWDTQANTGGFSAEAGNPLYTGCDNLEP